LLLVCAPGVAAAPELSTSDRLDARRYTAVGGRTIDRSLLERPMVLQAWGAYGTAWPVVHQHLGVRPDLGRRRLEVVPQLPAGQRRIVGGSIRLGGGAADVIATRRGRTRRTLVDATVRVRRLVLGHGRSRRA
jgi:hypothetical protein